MKPCLTCKQPKTYHTWNMGAIHDFVPDNLYYLERKVAEKERQEKNRKLNFCQLCNNIRKSPFGICKECSEKVIESSHKSLELMEIR